MSQLVAYYDEKPMELKGQVEIHQMPMASASGSRSVEGAVRPSLVYVPVASEAGQFLVPFGEYDEWSLRDRYNEAIRIMNTLGASSISCESFREVRKRRRFRVTLAGRGPVDTAADREQRLRLQAQRRRKHGTRPTSAALARGARIRGCRQQRARERRYSGRHQHQKQPDARSGRQPRHEAEEGRLRTGWRGATLRSDQSAHQCCLSPASKALEVKPPRDDAAPRRPRPTGSANLPPSSSSPVGNLASTLGKLISRTPAWSSGLLAREMSTLAPGVTLLFLSANRSGPPSAIARGSLPAVGVSGESPYQRRV